MEGRGRFFGGVGPDSSDEQLRGSPRVGGACGLTHPARDGTVNGGCPLAGVRPCCRASLRTKLGYVGRRCRGDTNESREGVDMAVHEVRVDRSKTLVEEPTTGHNRWHPDISPIVRCEPGDEVVLETRDAFDGQMGPQATLDTVAAPNLDVVHPLTGPVSVEGAQPGDLLEVEIVEVVPDGYGYTVQVPGF